MEERITFTTSNGQLSALHFSPSVPSRYKILCLHGFCCDSRIFRYIGAKMSEKGFDIYALDLFGHGKSDGKKGDPNFFDTLKSIDELIEQFRSVDSSVYILGHSLGCTYALWYNLHYRDKVSGIILLAPFIWMKGLKNKGEAVPGFFKFLGLLCRRILTPSKLISAKKVVRDSILKTDEIQFMMRDPEINYYYSYRYIVDVIGFKNTKVKLLSSITKPTLILHGKRDSNVYSELSVGFYDLLKSDKKQLKLFDCDHWFYHSIFFNQNDQRYTESDRRQIVDSIVSWIVML